jgi:cytochrome c
MAARVVAICTAALVGRTALLAQDSNRAPHAFDPCSVCHSVDGSSSTGPTLQGILGRKSGSVAGFRYSRAMKNAAVIWDEGSLDRYLSDPQQFVPGNVMPMSGVPDGAQRAAIIAYLKTVSP